ncbi:hypothetical protein ACHAO7_008570 [Fusarium culmorum]
MPSVPQAQVPWLAVSLTFEIFSKPFKEPGINRAGLLDVISKIQEYMSLSDYLVDDNGLQSDLHRKLEKDTVELYKALLSYQIKSIYCFHKNELKRFFRNVFKIDDWSSQLDAIKAAETLVWEDVNKFQNQVMVDHLRRHSSDAQSSLKALTEMSMGMRRLIQDQQEREIETDNKECRQHLKQTDPSLDKERILDTKGNLLRESYGWVIDHPQFQDWKTNVHHRRLWIRGEAGKGKTMLLCGIIEELKKDPFHRLCYFFCQATDEKLRDGKCVLRGLLFHLIKQCPWLISHVRKDYDDSGEKLFNNHNAWQALRKIFLSVLNDESLDEVTIIVDALDKCMINRDELLKFICDVSSGSRAKLIVSSRPLSTIQKALQDDGSNSSMLALELNDDLISDAVKRFIDNRVASLAKTEPFQHNPNICDEITKHLTDSANNTFLWVALVCRELSSGTVQLISHVKAILKNSPPGLDNLYDQMLETIRRESRDFEIRIEILAANSVVTRPVTAAELLCILDANVASELNVEIWDPSTGNLISKHRAHKFTATSMAISSDSFTFAYFSKHNSTILIWNRTKEVSSRKFSCSERVRGLALSAGGEWLAVSTAEKCIVWNTLNGDHAVLNIDGVDLEVVWSMGGQWLATHNENNSIDVWKRQAGQWSSRFNINVKESRKFIRIALSSDAKLLAVASLSNISVWNTETGALVWAKHMINGEIISISFSNDSLRLLTGLYGNEIKVWDLSNDVERKQTPSNEGPLSLRWFDANRFSVYSSGIRENRLYGKDTSTRIYLDSAAIASISPDGQQVTSASTGFIITIWDALTGNVVRQLEHKPEEATFGSQTYQGTQEHEVQCSTDNAANTHPRQTRGNSEHGSVHTDDSMDSSGSSGSSGSEQSKYPEALSFDNTVQLASSVSGIIRIWNTSDGTCLRTLDAGDCHKNDLMVFSKTGRQLVVRSYTDVFSFTEINLWDTVNGTCLSI